jgi:folate-binding protein YgfZ
MVSAEHYRALREGAALIDRSSRGRLILTGQDRRSYLQGLLTNDIAALEAGAGCYAAYLTPQGRMIADMRVFELGDALLVDLEGHVTAAVRERWEMFIFSEDVQVADVTATTAQFGVYGPAASRALAITLEARATGDEPTPTPEQLDQLPLLAARRWAFGADPAHVLRSDDVGVMGFDVVVPMERREDMAALLQAHGAAAIDPEAAEVTRIEAGHPRFGVDMDETTIPLEAGIEGRAISLTKGCYVGQEIIIRVLHRGHGRVAKRLVRIALAPGAPVPAAGDRIVSGDREIGHVTSAAESLALGRPLALGYVHRDFAEPATAVEVAGREAEIRVLGGAEGC